MDMVSKEVARRRIAKRIALELSRQSRTLIINLGVGIPTMVATYIESDTIYIQAENGMLGVGTKAEPHQVDRNLINAGREPITETAGCCYFDSSTSFGMIRGGHVDATVIGAFEVDEKGNIANWVIPNGRQLGVGGAMDLVSGAKQVIVAMRHTSSDGTPKLVKNCTLPITGFQEVDLVVTELGLFRFTHSGVTLEEIAPEIELAELKKRTGVAFEISPRLRKMEP